jgi:hypothetical protein
MMMSSAGEWRSSADELKGNYSAVESYVHVLRLRRHRRSADESRWSSADKSRTSGADESRCNRAEAPNILQLRRQNRNVVDLRRSSTDGPTGSAG